MKALLGKWKIQNSENFDEYMQAFGISEEFRKMALANEPDEEIIQSGDDEFTIIMTTSHTSHRMVFKLGEEFEMDTPDGRKVTCLITEESPEKFKQTDKGDGDSVIYRELVDGNYVLTMEYRGVKCVRNFVPAD